MKNKAWRTYEEVTRYLLGKYAKYLGLEKVEGKQVILGQHSRTRWEVDGKGIKDDGIGFVIIECRHYRTSKQNQEKLAALAYRITDTGASAGIIVSPLGLQSGAKKIASSEKILEVILDADSTPYRFAMQFLDKLIKGDCIHFTDNFTAKHYKICQYCGNRFEVKARETICAQCASGNLPNQDPSTRTI